MCIFIHHIDRSSPQEDCKDILSMLTEDLATWTVIYGQGVLILLANSPDFKTSSTLRTSAGITS